MRRTAILLIAACLTLAGCSGSSDAPDKPQPTATKTVTAPPSLSDAEARQACVDGWLTVMTADDYDPDQGLELRPAVCEGLPEQAEMYTEAMLERNEANRESLDACLEDPSCTNWPLPSP